MALSPMMKHYLEMKEKHPDAILFYRLGDFYEMFFEDAEIVSRELELTLTGKDCGLEKRAPMCGIPHHAAPTYISRLIAEGYKVAICEQLSDPKASKGLVQRDVVQIVTPGTVFEHDVLEAKRNNFLMSVYGTKNKISVCYSDISTGFIEALELSGDEKIKLLDDVLARVKPSEILCNLAFKNESYSLSAVKLGYVPEFYQKDEIFEYSKAKNIIIEQFAVNNLSALGLSTDKKELTISVGSILLYFEETQKRLVSNIKKLSIIQDSRYVHLDILARKNLELTQSSSLNQKKGSLLWLLDKTKTSMGGRLLKSFIDQPLRDEEQINDRLDSVEELAGDLILRESLADTFNGFLDIERKCSKIAAGTISPKECLALAETLKRLPEIKNLLMGCKSKLLHESGERIVLLSDIQKVLTDAIDPMAPANLKDGGYILSSYNEELYQLRNAGEYGKQWLAEYEKDQKEKTGIKNLKTGYNRVFGYYIEVTNSGLSMVPETYIRKQTTTNSERYITPELKEMEYKILNSKEQSIELESKLYAEIKNYLVSYISELSEISSAVALADCLISFASVAADRNYVRPMVSNKFKHIKITAGRHPVVEAMMEGDFSSNDTILDEDENRTMLITGPNMAGKSTYMRQVAIITLMAHMGSFVPAKSAEISIIDRVFTRVGASDDLAFGQSTFMVEMSEVSNIINNATDKSLIILDEVGRGTSTYDGMSIASAIIEFLSKHLHAKTLFSTHYHELTDLEGRVDGVKNYRVMVKEWDNNIVFLHKIARGSANRSFGIEVAKLAGLPNELISRAKEILVERESAGPQSVVANSEVKIDTNANVAEVINILKDTDMDNISPLMAFGTLQNLVDKVKK